MEKGFVSKDIYMYTQMSKGVVLNKNSNCRSVEESRRQCIRIKMPSMWVGFSRKVGLPAPSLQYYWD